MSATSCKFEFQCKHFGCNSVSGDLFHHLQWSRNRWIFLGYRFLMSAYCISWLIVGYVTPTKNFWYFLSNWSEVVLNLYFLWAFFVAIYAAAAKKKKTELNEPLRWFHIINWILFNVTAVSAFQITIFYWALLAPSRTLERNLQPVTFHIHGTNTILMIVDAFMVAFPTRWLHFIYTAKYGLVYTLFLLILHGTGTDSSVYSIVDFVRSPGIAAAALIFGIIIFPIILHSILFGFYHLRALIARCTVLKKSPTSASAPRSVVVEMGKNNSSSDDSKSH